jgi:hypothetical protein
MWTAVERGAKMAEGSEAVRRRRLTRPRRRFLGREKAARADRWLTIFRSKDSVLTQLQEAERNALGGPQCEFR